MRPLLGLKPYLLGATRGCLRPLSPRWSISAGATLAVPLAVRRMIDLGFTGIEPDLIDKYFITLVGVGLILALGQRRALLRGELARRAGGRRHPPDVFKHLTGLSPAFYEAVAFGRGDVAAHRRHDAGQGSGEHGDLAGACATCCSLSAPPS